MTTTCSTGPGGYFEGLRRRIETHGTRIWPLLSPDERDAVQSVMIAPRVSREVGEAAEKALDAALRMLGPAPQPKPDPANRAAEEAAEARRAANRERARAFFAGHGLAVPALNRPTLAGLHAHLDGRSPLPRPIAKLIGG